MQMLLRKSNILHSLYFLIKPFIMTLEKLEALVGVMSNEQYERFQSAVLNIVNENGIFTANEMEGMERRILKLKKKESSASMPAYSFSMLAVPAN